MIIGVRDQGAVGGRLGDNANDSPGFCRQKVLVAIGRVVCRSVLLGIEKWCELLLNQMECLSVGERFDNYASISVQYGNHFRR
jgi:hypothetical protein